MRAVTWPAIATKAAYSLHIRPHSRGFSSPPGFGQYEIGTGAEWAGVYSVPAMRTNDALTFRAFLHSLRGASGTFRIQLQAKDVLTGYATFTDDTDFDDDTEFDDTISATAETSAAASAGATSIDVATFGGIEPSVGDFAYIGDLGSGQLVRVTAVSTTVVEFRPALRGDIDSGTALNFANVSADFHIVNNPGISIVAGGRSQPVDVEFREFRS